MATPSLTNLRVAQLREPLCTSVVLSRLLTPLFTVTPNLFWNLGDGSALLQVVTQNSLGDNLVLLGALGVPMGPSGTEYGGIETDIPGVYFSSDMSLFLQLGWYY